MNNISLTCSNKKVIDFFNQHPNLDFETICITFTEIMEALSKDMTSSLGSNIATQILGSIRGLQTQINSVSDNFNKIHFDIGIKFNDFKKDYIEDIKMILSNNTSEKFTPLIKDANNYLYLMIEKTISEIVPKNNEFLIKQLQEQIKQLNNSITEDTNKLLNSTLNEKSLNDFIKNLDVKLNNTISNSQQIINSSITATENRLDTSISRLDTSIKDIKSTTEKNILDIKDISSSNQNSQLVLQKNITEVLKKMENSTFKGKISENILFNIIQALYPSAQIDVVGEEKETGDIILKRKNKPTILIENKNWCRNVIQDEVKKFIRDIENQKCCGLFLSQNFGIANKENFEININDGNILVYVHEVNNNAEKIKIAIDIIDNFKEKLDELALINGDGYNIDKEILDEINTEYQDFITNKLSQIKNIKDFSTKIIKQLEDSKLPCLEKFLSSKYAFSTSKYVCEYCGFVAKNLSSISAHKRGCKSKINFENKTEEPYETPIEQLILHTKEEIGDINVKIDEKQKTAKKNKTEKTSVKINM